MIILKNPDNGADITHTIDHKEYVFPKGKSLAFEDAVADVLLGVYGFLEKTAVDEGTDKEGKKVYRCSKCEYATEHKALVYAHISKDHDGVPKVEMLEEDQKGSVGKLGAESAQGTPVVSLEEKKHKEMEDFYSDLGIPATNVKDKDGVEWYGAGLEKDVVGAS